MKLTDLIRDDFSIEWLRTRASGQGVRVAVIDSGVDGQHRELQGHLIDGCEIRMDPGGVLKTEIVPASDLRDRSRHGTAVAGIIASIAPEARIVSVQVLAGWVPKGGGEALLRGLEWALDQDIRLINMSLATEDLQRRDRLHALCERAYEQNSIIVASRRNRGAVGMPAMFSSVISVDREEYAGITQFGFRPCDIIEYDASGNAVKVLQPGGGYSEASGTSYATPHVAGVVALLLELVPDLTGPEAKALLRALGLPRPGPGENLLDVARLSEKEKLRLTKEAMALREGQRTLTQAARVLRMDPATILAWVGPENEWTKEDFSANEDVRTGPLRQPQHASENKRSASHYWEVTEQDGLVRIGVHRKMAETLGTLIHVSLPEVGECVFPAEPCGVLESNKAAIDIFSPVSGRVVEINDALNERPATVTEDPTHVGWLFKVLPTTDERDKGEVSSDVRSVP